MMSWPNTAKILLATSLSMAILSFALGVPFVLAGARSAGQCLELSLCAIAFFNAGYLASRKHQGIASARGSRSSRDQDM